MSSYLFTLTLDGTGNHYKNMLIQIYRKFHFQTLKNFQIKNSDIFHVSAQNINCGYSLDAKTDLTIRWSLKSYYRFCRSLAKKIENAKGKGFRNIRFLTYYSMCVTREIYV